MGGLRWEDQQLIKDNIGVGGATESTDGPVAGCVQVAGPGIAKGWGHLLFFYVGPSGRRDRNRLMEQKRPKKMRTLLNKSCR